MNKSILIHLLAIFIFSIKMNGQNIASDTIRNVKIYKEIIPKIELDSALISPNANFALILKGGYLNGCYINYWTLYENGLNKIIAKYIVMHEGYAYFLTYSKDNIIDKFTYEQNDEKFSWDVTKKCRIKDFLKQYNLRIKPKNKTKKLIVYFDTLQSIKVKIPRELDRESIGDSIDRIAQRIEIKFKYKEKLIYATQISFLSAPEDLAINDSEYNFEAYYNKIKQQIKQSIYWNDYGMIFFESDDLYFIHFKIESTYFTGWRFERYENNDLTYYSSGSVPEAKFVLLSKNYH